MGMDPRLRGDDRLIRLNKTIFIAQLVYLTLAP